MHLAAFLNAGPMGTSGWRHPDADPGFLTAGYYRHVAKLLEAARFDLAFIPDALSVPRSLGGSFAPAVQWGSGSPRLDPLVILGVMAGVTEHIGLAATLSTGYHEPFHLARALATFDHVSDGRAGWNIVTSFQDAEAQNFGQPSLPPRDARYARAEEVVSATTQLWDSWDDGVLQQNKATGEFGSPEKVRSVDYRGEYVSTQGPLNVPRSPQGYPLLIQAGASPSGRDFAARWADVIFCSHESLDSAITFYQEMKKRVADHGRNPQQVRILPAATVVVGESDADAQRKHQAFADRVHPLAGLSRLAYHVNVDLTQYDLDGPLPELGEVGVQGHYDEVREFAQREKLSIREIGRWYGARTEGNMVGSVDRVVDTMEQWLERGAADGFMIQATHLPGAFEEFARDVVPELQRRGLHKTEYQGSTAREHFGLPRPGRDEWQHRALRSGR
ncbi:MULTISPECIES: LLM class flavin-dependent oxidoreductase [unclassified Pantoea]|uniref:LLM class flavin-dependent oxidoreductase n=1 Tax=unclassified Pantoea TaxID=2630326 RepID=UPI001CD6DB37|nr:MULTISPECIES: LLM class flavin-dependent oxidoreductase [unclassified Pantoea]MCA1179714.1 LLM class flavin-dependent oxidoreductase [Pantoea sp. alder69]MCA1252309.1 LLM class flavin-dependent oxidoreductase [Pantoea sp. alder70]MCA1268057.1 LLM class flavin-dependent oxidoreductase [Pantoea sp. alder81]